ncbi:F-box/kelch-repeat protein At3g23880-like [Chenopodium quinoa]|uniref:F-box/kelch-repeat protein At3g23880-like n=1 Tax=Chenopodium quinoa TaxID=63459 RepID=UPI000B797620|nr:F-box/kelch-repeat protein At3g23880-like [Chenopodium quinoa]
MMNNNSSPKTIPDDLIMDNILTRLEVRPLLCFKSVSRGWLSMISSPEFAKKHFELMFPSHDQNLIVQEERDSEEEDKFYLSFDNNYNLIEYTRLMNRHPTLRFNTLNTRVVGSSNGLLCMYDEDSLRLYVWNPATNHCRETIVPLARGRWDDFQMKCIGFGYVSSIDDYKIGCFVLYNQTLQILMFSLKTGIWTQKPQTVLYYPLLLTFEDENPAFVGDTIYWIPQHLNPEINYIIGLDLVEEDMVFIPVIARFPGDWVSAKLFRMEGCLALCLIQNYANDEKSICHVWKMKREEYGEEAYAISWKKVLCLNYVGTDFNFLFETGKCLVSQISYQSHRLILHELSKVSKPKQEQEQEQQEEQEQERQKPPDEGTIVWESADGGSLANYFSSRATFGYSESLVSPLEENED